MTNNKKNNILPEKTPQICPRKKLKKLEKLNLNIYLRRKINLALIISLKFWI